MIKDITTTRQSFWITKISITTNTSFYFIVHSLLGIFEMDRKNTDELLY